MSWKLILKGGYNTRKSQRMLIKQIITDMVNAGATKIYYKEIENKFYEKFYESSKGRRTKIGRFAPSAGALEGYASKHFKYNLPDWISKTKGTASLTGSQIKSRHWEKESEEE